MKGCFITITEMYKKANQNLTQKSF
jgi:hypothetical protein